MPLSAARGTWRCGLPVATPEPGHLHRARPARRRGDRRAPRAAARHRGRHRPRARPRRDARAGDPGRPRPRARSTARRTSGRTPSTRCCGSPTAGCSPHHGSRTRARARGESESRIADGVRVRVSRSLDTYAGWLADRAASAVRGRVFRLGPSPVELPGARPLDAARLGRARARVPGDASCPCPVPRSTRGPARQCARAAARVVLSRWAEHARERRRAGPRRRRGPRCSRDRPTSRISRGTPPPAGCSTRRRRQRLGDPTAPAKPRRACSRTPPRSSGRSMPGSAAGGVSAVSALLRRTSRALAIRQPRARPSRPRGDPRPGPRRSSRPAPACSSPPDATARPCTRRSIPCGRHDGSPRRCRRAGWRCSSGSAAASSRPPCSRPAVSSPG